MYSFFEGNTLFRQDSNNIYRKANDIIPVNHWKLQEASGTDVNDSGDSPLTLTNTNASINQSGKIDKAYSFNGTSSYLDGSNLKDDSTGTVSTWVKLGNINSTQYILTNSDNTIPTDYIGLRIDGTGKIGWVLNNGTVSAVNTNATLSVGVWYFITITCDGSAIKIYIDGVLQSTTGTNIGQWFDSISANSFAIGRLNSSIPQDYLNGDLEDIRIYDYALSDQEIATIYNAGNGTLNNSLIKMYPTYREPVNHWKLQEEAGTDVNDSMNTEVLTNVNTTINQAGKINKCYDFDGSGQRLRSTYTPTGTEGTLCFWVNIDAFDNGAIITSSDEASTNYYWSIRFTISDIVQIMIREGAISYATEGTTSLSTGVWYHFAVVSLDDSYKVYINGTEETLTGDNDGKWFGDISNRDNFVIGAFQRTSVSGGFDGRAEDIRLYDYPLSTQEIKNLYNNGKGLLL